MPQADAAAARRRARPLRDVAQGAHVARPGHVHQRFESLGREAGTIRPGEVRREHRDVVAVLAQQRQADLDATQAVVEILAQGAFVDHEARVAVRRRSGPVPPRKLPAFPRELIARSSARR